MRKQYRLGDLVKELRVGKSTIYLWVQQGKFPAGRKVSPRIRLWSEDELKEWLDSKADQLGLFDGGGHK